MKNNLKSLLTESGKIAIAALDHRGSLQESLNLNNPGLVTREEMMNWKKRMIALYEEEVSGILIDPVFGKELVDLGASCGWMMSLEKSGYRGGKEERVTELLPDWGVKETKGLGVGAVKLLLYYDPENKELAQRQRELALRVGEECEKEGMVFLLEPLSYKIEGTREQEVLRIAEELAELPVDIWKFEYPETKQACERIGQIVQKPWVLLSAGMEYTRYKTALEVACRAGASGMAVGRAVWQEFGEMQGYERERFLQEESVARIRELVTIVEKTGKSVR